MYFSIYANIYCGIYITRFTLNKYKSSTSLNKLKKKIDSKNTAYAVAVSHTRQNPAVSRQSRNTADILL